MNPNYKYKQRYNPKSNRLKDFDYSSDGGYFVTICTKNKENYFGDIKDGKMIINETGNIVKKYYFEIPKYFPNIIVDDFIVMPNHLHFIIFIQSNPCRDVDLSNLNNSENKKGGITGDKNCMNSEGLGKIMKWYKGRCSFEIHKLQGEKYFAWQRNYFDKIIRKQDVLEKIRKYIKQNPLKWELEKNNKEGVFM